MSNPVLQKLIFENFASIKKAMLVETQYELLKMIVARGSMTNAELQEITGKGPESCHKRLKDLHTKGYLSRAGHEDPTGGIYHTYYPLV